MPGPSRHRVNIPAFLFEKYIKDAKDDTLVKCTIVEITLYPNRIVTFTANIGGALFFYLPIFAFRSSNKEHDIEAVINVKDYCPMNMPDEQACFFKIYDVFYSFSNTKTPEGKALCITSIEFPDSNILLHLLNLGNKFVVRKNTRVLTEDYEGLPSLSKQRSEWYL
jgi:hypothetical protein